jgi:hypothetical protein
MIRPATPEDLSAIVSLGAKFHAASPYADIAYDPGKVAETVSGLMETGVVVVCEQGGTVKGMAAAMKGEVWFASGSTSAQELFWYAEDCGIESHGLRLALEQWAADEGCSGFSMICLENPKMPTLSRLYRMAGYRPIEHHFLKVL